MLLGGWFSKAIDWSSGDQVLPPDEHWLEGESPEEISKKRIINTVWDEKLSHLVQTGSHGNSRKFHTSGSRGMTSDGFWRNTGR